MSVSVKICGLKTPETVDAALDGGADHIGFIFFAKSPRNVDWAQAAVLRDRVRGRAHAVAVTVDADDATLDGLVDRVDPDILQLHGNESPRRVEHLRCRFGRPVMKAFSIREAADLDAMDPYLGLADRFLFDAKAPAGSELPGGNGVSFDWSLLAGLDSGINYMLSGGLNAANVASALDRTGATAVDVSSGVESSPGVKDPALISAFFRAIDARAA